MRRYLAGAVVAYLAPLLIAMAIILVVPSIRHAFFRSVVELPQFVTYLIIRKAVISRDLDSAVLWLNRQLDISQYFKTGSNTMMPGVIANTEYVVERARLKHQYQPLLPYLKRLVAVDPETYVSRIWLARALAESQPALAFSHLEAAVSLIASDSRAYRIAIDASISLNQFDKARKWCEQYQIAQLGGPRPHDYNTLFNGSGLRKLALEVHDKNNTPILVGNSGLRLGSERAYEFTLPSIVSSKSIRLHLGILPGTGVKFGGISLFGPRGKSYYSDDDLIIVPLKGFFTKTDRLVSNAVDGDTVKIYSPSRKFIDFDRISVHLEFSRLATSRFAVCNGVGVNQ
jgi:hypothetical protein